MDPRATPRARRREGGEAAGGELSEEPQRDGEEHEEESKLAEIVESKLAGA